MMWQQIVSSCIQRPQVSLKRKQKEFSLVYSLRQDGQFYETFIVNKYQPNEKWQKTEVYHRRDTYLTMGCLSPNLHKYAYVYGAVNLKRLPQKFGSSSHGTSSQFRPTLGFYNSDDLSGEREREQLPPQGEDTRPIPTAFASRGRYNAIIISSITVSTLLFCESALNAMRNKCHQTNKQHPFGLFNEQQLFVITGSNLKCFKYVLGILEVR